MVVRLQMFDDDFEEKMKEYERKREEERLAFLKKCHDKITDDGLVYLGLSHILAHRFRIEEPYPGADYPPVVYDLLNYYVDHVDGDFMKWLHSDDGPFVKTPKEILKIFPEFTGISSNARKVMKIANALYGLDMKYSGDDWYGDYIFSYSFDFNSFTPVDIDEVKKLKDEIAILEKHGVDTSELETKLQSYGFTDEQLEKI